jgi:uncharacterized protein YkwD
MPVRPEARHRAARRRRSLGVLCGVVLVPVAALAAIYLSGGAGFLRLGLTQASPQAGPSHGRTGRPSVTAGPSASAASTPSPSPPATPRRATRHRRAAAGASATPSSSAPSAASSPSGLPTGQQSEAVSQVLALINQARAQAGLPAYTLSAGLDTSSAAHNARMADGCGLSHQCPGEPPLGTRETDAGVAWTAAGENIGEGGPVADSASAIAQMAVTLTQDMLNEKPPDDGHRLNILSSAFTHIGIAVTIDGSGTVWMTQDFSN